MAGISSTDCLHQRLRRMVSDEIQYAIESGSYLIDHADEGGWSANAQRPLRMKTSSFSKHSLQSKLEMQNTSQLTRTVTRATAKQNRAHSQLPHKNLMAKREKIHITRSELLNMYGQGTPFKYLVAIVAPIALASFVDCFSVRREAEVLKNLVTVYDLNVRLWNHAEVMRVSLFCSTVHGTKYSVLGKQPFEVFEKYKKSTLALLDGLVKIKSQDLGLYGPLYSSLFSKNYNLCDDLVRRPAQKIEICGEGLTAFVKNSIEVVFQYVLSICEDARVTLQKRLEAGYGLEDMKSLWQDSGFKGYLIVGSRTGIHTNVYYLIAGSLLKPLDRYLLNSELSENTGKGPFVLAMKLIIAARLFFAFSVAYSVLAAVTSYYYFFKKQMSAFEVCKNVQVLLPWTLMMNNPLLSHHFND